MKNCKSCGLKSKTFDYCKKCNQLTNYNLCNAVFKDLKECGNKCHSDTAFCFTHRDRCRGCRMYVFNSGFDRNGRLCNKCG